MASFNQVILIGNVTREIELKYTTGGTAVAQLGLAVNDKRKDRDGQWIDEVTFVDITLFGRTAEVASEYAGKGSSIMINGKLKLDSWEDKHTGEKRSKLKVLGDRLVLLGSRNGPQATGNQREDYAPPSSYDQDDANLPF